MFTTDINFVRLFRKRRLSDESKCPGILGPNVADAAVVSIIYLITTTKVTLVAMRTLGRGTGMNLVDKLRGKSLTNFHS